jgi:hypothetical protein
MVSPAGPAYRTRSASSKPTVVRDTSGVVEDISDLTSLLFGELSPQSQHDSPQVTHRDETQSAPFLGSPTSGTVRNPSASLPAVTLDPGNVGLMSDTNNLSQVASDAVAGATPLDIKEPSRTSLSREANSASNLLMTL